MIGVVSTIAANGLIVIIAKPNAVKETNYVRSDINEDS
jgi:hypothetical protein